jgi:hypothetical protein
MQFVIIVQSPELLESHYLQKHKNEFFFTLNISGQGYSRNTPCALY